MSRALSEAYCCTRINVQTDSGGKVTDQKALDNLVRSLATTHRIEVNAVKRPRVGSSTSKAKDHLYSFLGTALLSILNF